MIWVVGEFVDLHLSYITQTQVQVFDMNVILTCFNIPKHMGYQYNIIWKFSFNWISNHSFILYANKLNAWVLNSSRDDLMQAKVWRVLAHIDAQTVPFEQEIKTPT